MVNDVGKRVKEALPSTPVEITGLHEVPLAGDRFMVFEDEKKRVKSVKPVRKNSWKSSAAKRQS